MNSDENQIILVDKPSGMSSFGVVAKVRGFLKAKYGHKVKVGHTGTLDPFATGLLILLTGKMTKHADEFLHHDKIYEATLRLGCTSTTGDPEGEIAEVISSKHGEAFSETEDVVKMTPRELYPRLEEITSAISSFVGTISQTPPRFSAVKIDGERAYKLARKGIDFEPPTRKVTVYSIKILRYNYPDLVIRVHCSSGTYIRTLASDIGKSLGTGAYCTALRRLQIADYSVDDAHPLSDFTS